MLKNNRGSSTIGLIVIIIMILVGLGIYFLNNKNKGNDKNINSLPNNEVMTNESDVMLPKDDTMIDDDKTNSQDENMINDATIVSEAETRVFQIDGSNFAFSQTEIRAKQGDRVRIELTSVDGFHDWVVDEFAAATKKVNTGETAYVEFIADKKGTYEYYCSVGKHRALGMVGKLIVE